MHLYVLRRYLLYGCISSLCHVERVHLLLQKSARSRMLHVHEDRCMQGNFQTLQAYPWCPSSLDGIHVSLIPQRCNAVLPSCSARLCSACTLLHCAILTHHGRCRYRHSGESSDVTVHRTAYPGTEQYILAQTYSCRCIASVV